jgi:hypothetical protein
MADFFADILNKPSGEASRPTAVPPGTYLCVVDGPYRTARVGADQTETVDFTLKILSVIEGDAAEMASHKNGNGVLGESLFGRFWMTEKALYRLDDFFNAIGLPKGTSYKQNLAEAPNHQVVVNVTQRPAPDGSRMFNEIRGYASP